MLLLFFRSAGMMCITYAVALTRISVTAFSADIETILSVSFILYFSTGYFFNTLNWKWSSAQSISELTVLNQGYSRIMS